MRRYVVSIPLVIVCSVVLAFSIGCETQAQNDALIGGGIGAGAGAIIGHQSGHAGTGALIGGAVGGGTGYVIGNERDKKQGTAVQSQQQQTNTVTVSVTNSNGSVTPVKLIRSGNNYTGPRGEVYDHLPTEAELKSAYGF